MPLAHLTTLARAPRLVLVGSFGAGNLGDELLLAGFLTRLKKIVPQVTLTIVTGDARATRAWHGRDITTVPMLPVGLRSILTTNWLTTIRAIRACDAVIFPGGGLFTDEESLRAVFLWAIHILAARFFWKPVYLFGQSVGPFRTMFGRRLAGFTLRLATLIATRDHASVDELHALSIAKERIVASHDSALYLAHASKKQTVRAPKNILLAVRDYPRLDIRVWHALGTRIDADIARGAYVTFAAWGAGDDDALARLAPYCRHFKKIKRVKLPIGASMLLAAIKKYDLVIGMRLHALVAAHLTSVPSIGVAYSRKVREFQTSVRQPLLPLE